MNALWWHQTHPDLYFSTTFDLCSLEASPVSFWEICPIYYIKALKEVITIMVSSFILSKLSFLAVDLKKEPWKGWALSEATIKFWVLLAALSNCFFWKKSCTLCNDSSAITRTKNDHTGSWSSSWGVLCSRTLISEASGWRWKISNTVIWIHLEEDVRATWRLEQDYKIVFKQSKWSWGEILNENNTFTALPTTFDVDHSSIGHGCRTEEVACFWEGGLEEVPQLLP